MSNYSQAETTDAIAYVEEFARYQGEYFLPDGLHSDAFNLVIRFGRIALAIDGTGEGEGLASINDPQEKETLERLGDVSLRTGVSLLRKITVTSIRRLEREHRLNTSGHQSTIARDKGTTTGSGEETIAGQIEQTWQEHEATQGGEGRLQQKSADLAIENWYKIHELTLEGPKDDIERDLKLGEAEQTDYKNAVQRAERELYKITPDKIANYLRDNVGEYLTYDDLALLFIQPGGNNKFNSIKSQLSIIFTQDLAQPLLEEEAIVIHKTRYQLHGQDRSRVVIVALPEAEDPQWPGLEANIEGNEIPAQPIATAEVRLITTEEQEGENEQRMIQLEKHLKRGVLILTALKAGISAAEIAGRTTLSEPEIIAIGEDAQRHYIELSGRE